jgi:carbonic anhydrase
VLEIIYRYDPHNPVNRPSPPNGREACRVLEQGNREFAEVLDPLHASGAPSVQVVPLDLRDFGIGDSEGIAPQQRPFAVVLGCSDARVPTELVFNQACNSLFVVRVAGNVLGSECLGSIDFALHNLGESIKALVVLGHSGCGAVTAAVDAFLQPRAYLDLASSHPLRAIVDRLLLAVRAAAKALEVAWGIDVASRPGYRHALIETAVTLNAAFTASTLRQEFRDRLPSDLDVVFGVYNLVTRRVQLPTKGALDVGLARTSEDVETLFQLADELARCEVIRELLTEDGTATTA